MVDVHTWQESHGIIDHEVDHADDTSTGGEDKLETRANHTQRQRDILSILFASIVASRGQVLDQSNSLGNLHLLLFGQLTRLATDVR